MFYVNEFVRYLGFNQKEQIQIVSEVVQTNDLACGMDPNLKFCPKKTGVEKVQLLVRMACTLLVDSSLRLYKELTWN